MPNSFIAPLASPVPIAASAVRLVNRCNAISIVRVSIPAICAAYLSPPRASVVVPILLAVFASASVACKLREIRRPNPAVPTRPTMAVLAFRTAPATAFNPLVAEPNPALVLSSAFITICTLLAIVLAHYLEVSKPLIKMTNWHLLCFFYRDVKPISQRK